MKNLDTYEFCSLFCACSNGFRFALKYKTMRDCYDALLRGEAGDHSAGWAIWVATRNGVMADRDLRLFAVKCARRVQHLMRDERSLHALDVAERYANGEATTEELKDAEAAAFAAASYAAYVADKDAKAEYVAYAVVSMAKAEYVAYAAELLASAVRNAVASDAENEAQLCILAEFGNPFEEVEE